MIGRILGAVATAYLALGGATAEAQVPSPPARPVAALVGTYDGGSTPLDVRERDGTLYLNGGGFQQEPVRRSGTHFAISRDGRDRSVTFVRRHGAVTAVIVDGTSFPRRDYGGEVEAQIRAGGRSDITAIRARARAITPPAEAPPERAEELRNLEKIIPNVRLDIQYAKTNNFVGVPLYEKSGAFLQRPAAEALARVASALRPFGYGLLIHDGYRPWYVTRIFWDVTPDSSHVFVADPAKGSRHNRGAAVDLTLYRLADGKPVEMPSRYDEMSVRAYADYPGGTTRQRWHRDLLRREMERQGFTVYPEEWWHFDYRDWQKYAIQNLSLPALLTRRR